MSTDVMRYLQRCYPQIQTAFDVIPNTAGVATVAGSDCCLITSLSTDPTQAEIPRPDKTGTLDELIAQGGRRISAWSAAMSMAGNGTAGVAPDCKNFLQAAFGKAPMVVAGTSVTYSLDDLLYYLAIYNFNAPSDATQFCAFNALVQKLEMSAGGDVPTLTFSGENGWTYDNNQSADANTDPLAKGGLTAFPNEPAAPVVNGAYPPGFKITATIDGTAYTTLLTVKITLEVARELRKNTNSEFARAGAAGARKVSFDFSLTDDNSPSLATLKQKVMDRQPIAADFTIGTKPGNTWDWSLSNCILPKPKYGDEGPRRKMDFTGCRAYPSSIGAKDQLSLTIR